jgi:uncharacterized protein (TIGR03437 family)
MRTTWKTFAITVFCCQAGLAQAPPVPILQIDTENNVRYIYDTQDFSAFATVPTPFNQTFPTFATWITQADIVAVNGKPAKGLYLTRQVAINLAPAPPPGQGIADLVATNIVDRILVLLQPDGTPVGSIMMHGLDGGTSPPGAPAIARQGNFAITGGTGAFLGMHGQFVSGPLVAGAVATRSASVKEDPARRRINGGGKAIFVLHLIPMTRPEVAITPTGPAIFHADLSPVTAARPAKAGEVLIVRATGLGPTRATLDPGQPFPMDAAQEVNSPVEVSVNGQSADVINKIGWPGLIDTYRVDFRVPDTTAPGTAGIQLTAAWIAGSTVNIPIQ